MHEVMLTVGVLGCLPRSGRAYTGVLKEAILTGIRTQDKQEMTEGKVSKSNIISSTNYMAPL